VQELCLGKEGAETCKVLENFLTMVSTENSSFLQKFVWQDNLGTENCLSRGKTSVFPRLCSESDVAHIYRYSLAQFLTLLL
jgi:hypothetical protein